MNNKSMQLFITLSILLCSFGPIYADKSTPAMVQLPMDQYQKLKSASAPIVAGGCTISRIDYLVVDDFQPENPITLQAEYDINLATEKTVQMALLSLRPNMRLVSADGPKGPLFVRIENGAVAAFIKGKGRQKLKLVLHCGRDKQLGNLLNEVTFGGPISVGVVTLKLQVKEGGTSLLVAPKDMSKEGVRRGDWKHYSATISSRKAMRLIWASPDFAEVRSSAAYIEFGGSFGHSKAQFVFDVPGEDKRTVLIYVPKYLDILKSRQGKSGPPEEVSLANEDCSYHQLEQFYVINLNEEQRRVKIPVSLSSANVKKVNNLSFEYYIPLARAPQCPMAIGMKTRHSHRVLRRFVTIPGDEFEDLDSSMAAKTLLDQLTVQAKEPILKGVIKKDGALLIVKAVEDKPSLDSASVTVADIHVECFVTGDGSPPLIHIRYSIDNVNKPEFEIKGLRDGSRIVAAFSDGKRVKPIMWRKGVGNWAVPLTFFGKNDRSTRGIVDLYVRGAVGEVMKFSVYEASRLPLEAGDTGSLGRVFNSIQFGPNQGQDPQSETPMGQFGRGFESVAQQSGPRAHRPFLVDVYTPDDSIADISSDVALGLYPEPVDGEMTKALGPIPVPSSGKPSRWRVSLPTGQQVTALPVVELIVSVSRPVHRNIRGWLLFLGVIALVLGTYIPKYEHRLGVLAVGGLSILLGLLVAPPMDEQALRIMAAALVVLVIGYLSYLALRPEEDEEYAL